MKKKKNGNYFPFMVLPDMTPAFLWRPLMTSASGPLDAKSNYFGFGGEKKSTV